MVASVLKRGNVAIVSYATDPIGVDGDDIIRFVILAPIGSGTQIFFTDRNWNGTAFPAAGGGDGTFTYTAGADLPAGTVITITSAQLLAAGMDLSNNGDTVYVYQGTDANTPTTFLFAIDFGDGNTTFNGTLTNTGLTAGVDAVAVEHDQASYSGPSTQIPQTQLSSISNNARWQGHSGDDIGGTIYDDRADTSISGPLNNPDMQLFVVNNGGGQSDAIVRIDNDEAANLGTNLTRLFRDNPMFTRLEDITFDIEDGVWFAADNEGTDITRIVKGNIADLFNGNPNPTITVVFDYVNNGADPNDDKFIQGIEIDTVANRIFFGLGDILFGHELRSVDYNGGNSRNWGLIDLFIDPNFGFAGGIEDLVVDTANNTAYFSYVLVDAGAGQVIHNYVVRLTAPLNAAAPNPGVENYAIVNITNAGAPPAGYPAGRLPDAEGSIRGMDYHAATNTLWFVTGRLGAAGTAGIFTLNLTTGVYTEIWQQPSNNAHNTPQSFPTTLLVDIEVDSIGGRYYVTSLNSTDTPIGHDGTATDENGSRVWSGSLTAPIGTAPTFFASLFENTANGAGAGMEIDYAPTLTVGSAGSTYTESTNLPASPAGPTVDVATSPVVNDVDQAIIQGATVAVSTGFVTGDQLTFTNSGGITGSYNATTGVLTFTGNASFAAYQTVLDAVRFTNAGDNPTDYGASTSRIISFTVFDGLINSDPATATVLVVGINDAPVNTVGAAMNFTEDTSGNVGAEGVPPTPASNAVTGISVFDVDANPATQDITVTLSVGVGTLSIRTDVAGGITPADVISGNGTGTIVITATQNQINATLSALSPAFTGPPVVAAAPNGLIYTPPVNYNGATNLTITTNDNGFNGNDPGISGTGTSEQDSDNKVINITAVNDAPTVIDATQTAATILEDTPSAAGESVASLFTTSFSDALDQQQTGGNPTGSVANTLAGIAVVGGSTGASGSWQYFNGSIWVNIGAASTASAVLISAATAIRFNPALNFNGSPPDLIVHLVDSSGAAITNGAIVNLTGATGGTTRYSTATVALSESVTAVNDAPVNTVGGTLTVAEDSGATAVTGMSISDVDANPATDVFTVTLDVLHGTLTLSTVVPGGVGAGNVAGNGTATITMTGTINQINATLAAAGGLTYTPTGDYNGSDRVQITTNDGGATGLDPGGPNPTSEQDIDSKTINVTAVNDPVTGTAPASSTLDEDSVNFAISGMSISDIDATLAPAGVYVVTLSSTNGTMTLTTLTGLTFSAGDGTADATMTFRGTLADINTALATASYTPTAHYNGSATITLAVTDTFGGTVATGTGAATNDSDVINVTVTAVNDPVSTNAPPTATIDEDAVNAAITGLSISDVDATLAPAGVYEVTLSATNGGLSLTTLTGLTFTAGDGSGDATMTFHGTLADINTALATATYTPPANYNGPAQITLSATDTYGAIVATGTGAATNDSDIVNVTVTAINDTPVVTAAASGSSTEQVAGTVDATATISDIDLDALNGGNGNYAGATLNIANNGGNDANDLFAIGTSGAFTVNGANLEAPGGLVFATFSGGNGVPLVITFTGSGTPATTALVNAVAQSIQYTYTGDNPPVGGIDVAISLNDGAPGNAGQGSIAGHPAVGTDIIHLSITDTPENQPPVVDLNGTDPGIDFASAYTEDGTAAVIADTDVAITDPDVGDDITGATITITDAIAGDQLTVLGALPGSIVATGGGTATITLSGTGTQAEYQQALTQIRYSSTSNDPTVGGTDLTRSVSVTVTDGETSSTPAAITTVTVTGSNDPPAGTDATITAIEDTPRLLVQADFGFTDPDSADTLSAVTITGVTGGTLYYDADGTGGAGLPIAVATFPQTYTAAELAAGNVSYQANANLNGTGVGTITFQVTDNSGAPNNTDTSANTLTVDVTPINDQPNIPNSPTVTTDEQVAVTLNAAITVSDVDLDARNGGNGDYSGAAFAINRSVSNAEDVFSFDTAGAQFTVNGSNLESGGNVIATLAQSGGILNINFVNNGTVPTTALVNDVLQHLQYTNTSNEPPASVTLIYIIDDGAPGGGQGALGAPFNNIDGGQITINIDSINDAPSGADKTITIDEDIGQVLTTADFGFSDTDNDAFESAVVVSVTGGTLLVDDGNIVTPPVSLTSGTISAADIAAGYVTFQPTAHLNGSAAGAISFQVVDNGGTDNGGQNTDQSANTITFNIDSVNDAPAGTDKTVTGSEDDPYVFTAADFGFTDAADTNAFLAVRIMTFPANGTLFLDSDGPGGAAPVDLSTVGAGVYVSITDINAGELYFQPDPDEFGNGYANFTFAVQDDGGITNGGQDTDQSPNTMTIDIAPDNLPPAVDLDGVAVGVNYTVSYTEDAPGVAIGSGVTVTDPNSGTGDMIESATITLTDRVAGDSLTLTGALPPGIVAVTTPTAGAITIQITGPGTGAQYQALIESILYATTSQDPTVGGTDAARTITVTVNDGLVDSAVATTTVNITAVDDAAVAQPDAYTITEQGTIVAGNVFADNGSGVDNDPDGPPLAVSSVNGSSGDVGDQIVLPSGALLTLNANGTFDYDPNGAFDATPVPGTGASNTPDSDSFTYTLAGGNEVTVTITITGIDTDDDIIGTAGADTLIADGGTDRLIGLAGDDTYHVNSAGDLVLEDAGEGSDLVYTNTSYALAAGSSVETLSTDALGGTDPINLTGNELGNTLFGNAGANRLIGGGGADYMVGFGGDDEYYVDMLSDVVVEAAGEGRDVVYASASYALAAGSSVEILSTVALGDTTAINLTGNELVNVLYGNAGANRLIGGGGADFMVGFGGDDDYYVDAAGDVVIEAAGQGRDVVYASVSYVLAAGSSVEVLSTIGLGETTAINLTGNELANTITGNAGVNVLNGGAGVDYMAGLGGDDDYYVDNAGDVVAEDTGGGRDVVYTSTSYTLAAGSSVEILSTIGLLATTPINLTGNELGNGLFGNAGANVLNGGGGADYLAGMGGADSYAFTTALGGGNVDTIIDYSGVGTDGDDRILLDDAVFAGMTLGALDPGAFTVGTAALDADDRIIYDATTGALYFDADGNGAGAQVQFAILDGAPALTAGDFFVI